MRINGFAILLSLLFVGCSYEPLEEPDPPAYVKPVPENWQHYQNAAITNKSNYIKENRIAYEWFTNFAFSETDGTPYILLKLLPVIAPELWGSKENPLDIVGLFKDARQDTYPIARGFGISGFSRKDKMGNIDYASFSCGACHIGRVKTDTGDFVYLDGGVNAEFNVPLYLGKIEQTLQKIYAGETDRDKKNSLATNAFVVALDNTHRSNPNFFYGNYRAPGFVMDSAYEKGQIALFKENASSIVSKFAERSERNVTGYVALLEKNYGGFVERSLEGFPGMADATGISTVHAYNYAKNHFFLKYFANFFLPPVPGMTDFMSVWEQGKRKASWNKDRDALIHGGGQWNGDIPIPMYRNLAAQLTVGLDNTDIRVSAFGVELLDGLPATVYPFEVDIALAKKGEALFAKNCAQCHQPNNGRVYPEIGTDKERTYVLNWLLRLAAIRNFEDICSPDTEIDLNGKTVKPCAEFSGESLEGKKSLIISPNEQHYGYSARPLSGIWAQAPYLHNGSVPTIYHLLVPSERPAKFIKSQLTYDQKWMGFVWETKSDPDSLSAYELNTTSFYTLSNKGHDKDIDHGSGNYKLDWSDDKDGAMAIIEYLKIM